MQCKHIWAPLSFGMAVRGHTRTPKSLIECNNRKGDTSRWHMPSALFVFRAKASINYMLLLCPVFFVCLFVRLSIWSHSVRAAGLAFNSVWTLFSIYIQCAYNGVIFIEARIVFFILLVKYALINKNCVLLLLDFFFTERGIISFLLEIKGETRKETRFMCFSSEWFYQKGHGLLFIMKMI